MNSAMGAILMLPFLFFLFYTGGAYGQKVTRQTAVKAFSDKNYELAYSQFTELSTIYPGDPLYKYYCGASLVEAGKEPLKAATFLNSAASLSGAIISVPADCYFYLGRALQMSGKYRDAVQAYDKFTNQAGKKAAKDKDVPGYIKQCNEQKGMITAGEEKEAEIIKKDTVKAVIPVSVDSSKKNVNTVLLINKRDTLTEEFDKHLGEVLDTKIKADSLAQVSGKQPVKQLVKQETKDSVKAVSTNTAINKAITGSKTDIKPKTPVALTGVFSEFSIPDKAVLKPDDKVLIDPEVPAGLIYRIQVAVFRNPVTSGYFKGITPIQGFRNPTSGITTYYAGRFRKSDDAGKSLQKVKLTGFRDAFIVALFDKKAVSADRAASLEREWGLKPLFTQIAPADSVRDTIPPTLVFRVEVKRTQKPLPEDQVEVIRKMAGSRGFDIVNREPKQYIYLIGSFISYTSATEYADLLLRNGFKETKVVAWLGKREVPVDTARQLFDQQ